ncbi:phenylacetate-coenzyme A ligase [Arthrobacter sp. Hiyo4]|nr:phenylacetate-coenzyme A ligase [Arthrobacter sp. Hiyo4]
MGKENVLRDGEHGELVFTSLTKEALPIIRYRTKDLTRLLPGTARPRTAGWAASPAAATT